MYRLLLTLMVIGAISEFDLKPTDFEGCQSRECVNRLAKASRRVLKIDWKPISVFPEEAKKFH